MLPAAGGSSMVQIEQSVLSEIAERHEEAIRLTAYFLWEQDGRPQGRQDEYWRRARAQHERQLTCDGLLADNGRSLLS
jgi:hypothetical protein